MLTYISATFGLSIDGGGCTSLAYVSRYCSVRRHPCRLVSGDDWRTLYSTTPAGNKMRLLKCGG